MDSVKRTDVQNLALEVAELRKAVTTSSATVRRLRILTWGMLAVVGVTIWVVVDNKDQDDQARELARCVADSNSRQDALFGELLESNKDHRQAQRDLLSGPRTSDPVEIQARLDRYGASLGQNDAAADRLIAELGKSDDC